MSEVPEGKPGIKIDLKCRRCRTVKRVTALAIKFVACDAPEDLPVKPKARQRKEVVCSLSIPLYSFKYVSEVAVRNLLA